MNEDPRTAEETRSDAPETRSDAEPRRGSAAERLMPTGARALALAGFVTFVLASAPSRTSVSFI